MTQSALEAFVACYQYTCRTINPSGMARQEWIDCAGRMHQKLFSDDWERALQAPRFKDYCKTQDLNDRCRHLSKAVAEHGVPISAFRGLGQT